jgi:hypothetical protein
MTPRPANRECQKKPRLARLFGLDLGFLIAIV